eukprot:580205-Amphidinium_carterae.1
MDRYRSIWRNSEYLSSYREFPDSPDEDWNAAMNVQPLTEGDLEAAVNERLMNILTPMPVTETPVPTANAQIAFSGTSHRLEANPSDESVSVDPVDANVNPIGVEPKAVPKTPPPSLQMQPPP